MRISRVFALSLAVVTAVLAGALPSQADDMNRSWLRIEDSLLARAVARGERESVTFKALLDRLEKSDLIVYMVRTPANGLSANGRTQFVVQAGNRRFLRVTIRADQITRHVVALVGHELQHVAEVAATPDVVDAGSYRDLYRRIGYSSCDRLSPCFDTNAAVDVGYAVLSELGGYRPRTAALLAESRITMAPEGTVRSFRNAENGEE